MSVGFSCPRCGAPVAVPWDQRTGSVRCAACGIASPFVDGVLLLSQSERDVNYPRASYASVGDVEDSHFWFETRVQAVLAALDDVPPAFETADVLDIGTGTGHLLPALERRGMRVTGIDVHVEGLALARARSDALFVCDARGELPMASFDLVLLTDVLEHVDDDAALLRQASGVLRRGGRILATVPAHPWLWSAVDTASGHKRRYTPSSLRAVFHRAGVRPALVRYFNHAAVPVIAIHRLLLQMRSRHRTPAEVVERALRPPPALVDRSFRAIARLERSLRAFPIPFGGSLVAVSVRD